MYSILMETKTCLVKNAQITSWPMQIRNYTYNLGGIDNDNEDNDNYFPRETSRHITFNRSQSRQTKTSHKFDTR